jgi:hypothetical protein
VLGLVAVALGGVEIDFHKADCLHKNSAAVNFFVHTISERPSASNRLCTIGQHGCGRAGIEQQGRSAAGMRKRMGWQHDMREASTETP